MGVFTELSLPTTKVLLLALALLIGISRVAVESIGRLMSWWAALSDVSALTWPCDGVTGCDNRYGRLL